MPRTAPSSTFFSTPVEEQSVERQIQKAIRFIKYNPAGANFLEIVNPERGGDLEIAIKQDDVNRDLFHVTYSYVTVPGNHGIINMAHSIPHRELTRLAREYDQDKASIDKKLEDRANLAKDLKNTEDEVTETAPQLKS